MRCGPVVSALLGMVLLAGTERLAAEEPFKLLDLPGAGADAQTLDYASLPTVTGQLAVVRAARRDPAAAGRQDYDLHHLKFQLHSYLAWHGGRYWCIWSEGPPIEDEPTQEVRFATSTDGLRWSESGSVTGVPEAPYAYIARGLWVWNDQLLALTAHFKGKGAFGADKELQLVAWAWDEAARRWQFKQKLYDDAINNFPPQRLASGDWMLTRRDARFNVSVLIGGRESLGDWTSHPVVAVAAVPGFRPDEPVFWQLPDRRLLALLRDNGGSGRLFHASSSDEGRTWSIPRATNYPNATSKLFSLATSRGYRVLVSNAHPQVGRRELHVALAGDQQRFTRLARLDVPTPPVVDDAERIWRKFHSGIASLQYPHVIEHDGRLLITLSRNKKQIELLHVPLDALDALLADANGRSAP